ncbi:MAG: hypothetical protein AAGA56_02645 [Myxococcota bacterium]
MSDGNPRPQLPDSDDPFELLGVEEGASPRDIKRAYVRLIRVFRPESHAPEFERVRGAYEQATAYAEHTFVPPRAPVAAAEEAEPIREPVEEAEPIREPVEEAEPHREDVTEIVEGAEPHREDVTEIGEGAELPCAEPVAAAEGEAVEPATPRAEPLVKRLSYAGDDKQLRRLLAGERIEKVQLSPREPTPAAQAAIAYVAWADPTWSRARADRFTSVDPSAEGSKALDEALDLATLFTERGYAALSPRPLMDALKCHFALRLLGAGEAPLAELAAAVADEPTEYAKTLDAIEAGSPTLLEVLDALVGEVSFTTEEQLPEQTQAAMISDGLREARAAIQGDVVEGVLSIVTVASLVSVGLVFRHFGGWGWFALVGAFTLVLLLIRRDALYYRRDIRPRLLTLAAAQGICRAEILAIVRRRSALTDAIGRFDSEIEEDYAIDWCATLRLAADEQSGEGAG